LWEKKSLVLTWSPSPLLSALLIHLSLMDPQKISFIAKLFVVKWLLDRCPSSTIYALFFSPCMKKNTWFFKGNFLSCDKNLSFCFNIWPKSCFHLWHGFPLNSSSTTMFGNQRCEYLQVIFNRAVWFTVWLMPTKCEKPSSNTVLEKK